MDMHEGERFFADPETAHKWVHAVPMREVPAQYVVFKPLQQVGENERPAVVLFFVNPDQLSALVTLAGFQRGTVDNAIAPWCASCQSILFAYAEAEKPQPRGVIGFFDMSQRHRVDRDILSFTVPYQMFLDMEASVEDSFLKTEVWTKLLERQ
jgi:uncharacterized protein (DUF169 family)